MWEGEGGSIVDRQELGDDLPRHGAPFRDGAARSTNPTPSRGTTNTLHAIYAFAISYIPGERE